MGKGNTDPCKKAACAIQDCLKKNDYQEWKCQRVIEALYECCRHIGPGESVVCDGIHNKNSPDVGIDARDDKPGK